MDTFPPSRFFPPPETADPDGLVAVGGRLSPPWILDAYRHGIFPWPFTGDVGLMTWWSPDPRAVIEFDGFHVSRRLLRTCRSEKFSVTSDRDFAGVIQGCATENGRTNSTWLFPAMIRAYTRLFELGHAHSIEVWHEGLLAGGTYGVSIGGLFAAESKFYRVRDASKVALAHLVDHLRARGYKLLDIQQRTAHTARLGAIQIPRKEYICRLQKAIDLPVTFGEGLESRF
ncbi:MAG: leucyl/phenylalanyl-tRNA--protein transferase [Pirellulales bacterium]|nr:leucyl/phenylalanyl-tRNA--protein transferase [Pirellulales bacterium]